MDGNISINSSINNNDCNTTLDDSESHNPLSDQSAGNVTIDSSVITGSNCTCCDGPFDCVSTTSSYDPDYDEIELPIPVLGQLIKAAVANNDPPAWYDEYIRPGFIDPRQSKGNRITIKRDNRLVVGESLPTISVSNMRSLIPKISNFRNDMIVREISVALLSEIWEKVNCKKTQFEVEKMLQLNGLKYISTPRTTKRGGGAAIVVNLEKFTLEKIQILIPHNLEVVWGLMRPKKTTSKIREIIVAAFYSPPRSRKNAKLLDHLMSTTHFLLSKYPNAGLVLGGDKNNLNISTLLTGIPRLKQIVTKFTHKNKVLDVILTNMHSLYSVPIIAPPVPPDDPLCGVPSDHSTPIATPLTLDSVNQPREYVYRTYRPLPESGVREFGEWICNEEWGGIPENVNPTEQVLAFETIVNTKLDAIFPQKTLKINPNHDKPFITVELKKLDRQVKREYRKHNKSENYLRLKKSYDEKFKNAAKAYLEKNVRSLKEDDPGKAYRSLKKMAAQPGDCSDEGSFTLISHLEDNLTNEQSIERIAQHFAQISQEFPPINYNLLPDNVKSKLDRPIDPDDIPEIQDYAVYEIIRQSRKPRSSVPGDLPRRIVQEFGPELATPAGIIFRNIAKSGHWPQPWRVEYGTPLQKQSNPISEDQLRIISLTSYLSKVLEQFVVIWLLEYVGTQMDWGQYGGAKGSSISHYLIDFVNFILFNQDLKIPHAVVAVMIDFSKAFNRINHNIVITILSEMGVPGWLLKIVIGFLTERELVLRYKGGCSDRKSMPGGGPQGTKLGLFLFLILINAAGYPHLEKYIGSHITQGLNKRTPIHNIHMKYVDDMTQAEAINLRDCLISNPDPNPLQPLAYHDRTQHVLPADKCQLQDQLDQLVDYCHINQMRINESKSKAMIFNTGRKHDCMPRLTLPDMGGEYLEVVEQFKLLGVVLRSDMKWYDNSDYICQKGYSRLWMLRRLKGLGASEVEMLDVYQKQVRSVLELAVPVWQAGLTQQEVKQIERVQRTALYIILGDKYTSYDQALDLLECDKLSDRRYKLCETFAKKSQKHPKYQNWFCENKSTAPNVKTRSEKFIQKKIFNPVKTRTSRYENSPLPYLTDVLNLHMAKKK